MNNGLAQHTHAHSVDFYWYSRGRNDMRINPYSTSGDRRLVERKCRSSSALRGSAARFE